MAFKTRQKEDELIRVKIVDTDGIFEVLKVTLEEFIEFSVNFYAPKYYYKNGKGYPFPDGADWEILKGSFICLEV